MCSVIITIHPTIYQTNNTAGNPSQSDPDKTFTHTLVHFYHVGSWWKGTNHSTTNLSIYLYTKTALIQESGPDKTK
ncbi:hypothetical protein E2C01_096590 [Portunus trituberculatus]|uniref:Uncharacterized protein n=1 Tax=Portunus trituberculatus TaxID=210409 RepID=A0A5B7K789_PORTR|nr:hypothetical protein [Portunus trituberculatus]